MKKKIIFNLILISTLIISLIIPTYSYADDEEVLERAQKIYKTCTDLYMPNKIKTDPEGFGETSVVDAREVMLAAIKILEEKYPSDERIKKYIEVYDTAEEKGGLGGESEYDKLTEDEKEIIRTAREAAEATGDSSVGEKFLEDQAEQGNISQEAVEAGTQKIEEDNTDIDDDEPTISGKVVMSSNKTEYDGDVVDPIENPDAYKTEEFTEDAERIKDIAQTIIGVLKIVGVVVAVLTLIVLGIKYMSGGVSEKAEYKKTMIPFLIGAFMLIVGTQLVGIIYDLVTNVQ